MAISTLLVVILVVVIVIVAAIVLVYFQLGASFGKPTVFTTDTFVATDTSNTTQLYARLAFLSYEHWKSVAQNNLSAIMSEYSPQYEAFWFYANGSAQLEALNGKHDCNVITGAVNCTGVVISAWTEFFNYTSAMQFTVCGLNITAGTQGNMFAKATLWYFLPSRNETLRVPYQLDYIIVGNEWQLERDWFGFSGGLSMVMEGDVMPACSATS